MRRATRLRQHHANVRQPISIHALHEESDTVNGYYATSTVISIHALHEESDLTPQTSKGTPIIFQSTLSMRRATYFAWTHAGAQSISIHALHEESDRRHPQVLRQARYFNPRSP